MIPNPSDYIDLAAFSNIKIDLRYASPDNFVGENLYGDFKKALLHKDAGMRLEKSLGILEREKSGWSLVIFDALRSRSVQRKMWAKVKNTPLEKYICDPEIGSPHNFGMALDVGLRDENGISRDMGSGFDEFIDLSEPRLEERFLKEGRLSVEQLENRLVLRRCMTGGGFLQLPHEWWHYNALPEEDIRRRYPILE
jgi:D-alanyl-D-alanine dipeptidase